MIYTSQSKFISSLLIYEEWIMFINIIKDIIYTLLESDTDNFLQS